MIPQARPGRAWVNQVVDEGPPGGIAGIFLGIPGILFGPFAGVVLGELSLQRSLDQAGRAGFGTVVEPGPGVAGKLAIGIAKPGLFLLVRLF